MKISQLLGERYKERPSDCVIDSHALMVRGGYIKQVGNGIFSLYMPAKRIVRKIENIIREEMDNIGGQEVLFPVTMPASLWKESGRYYAIGDELARFKDRNDTDMVLGMTHEEASVDLSRDAAQSYTQYPFSIYQIQTKFRDEPRSRGGLIRVREFTMKDAYSFHTSWDDLKSKYEEFYHAYERIFARCGIPEVIAVQSDSGMMGGSVAHEFMLLVDIGEDSLVLCDNCDYKANLEAAESVIDNVSHAGEAQELKRVHTPGTTTIEAVCGFLGASPMQSMKAVVYQKNLTDDYVVAFIRGDLDVNETKLRNYLGEAIHPAVSITDPRIVAGFIGPYGMDDNICVVVDQSLVGINSLVCGGNEVDYHYVGLNIDRDCNIKEFVDIAKAKEGGICPVCGKHTLTIKKGIEVGNIFQLGTKYSEAMDMQYLDQNGERHFPIMGCYGIGVGRLMASVCEAKHDDNGPIWPISIAPWQVHLCALRYDQPEVQETAEKLYADLKAAGIEVIYDNRNVSAGIMFADADLLGVPIRLVASPRNLAEGQVEISTRDKNFQTKVPVVGALEEIRRLCATL